MVFLAFVLLTVSALVTHINAASTEQHVVHHACEGETFCHIKPENYPQEEIDRAVIQHLPQLHRRKREISVPAARSSEGNCEVMKAERIKPFSLKHPGSLPKWIVQSQWYKQEVPKVTCKTYNAKCFTSFTIGEGLITYCTTKNLKSSIVVYDPIEKIPKEQETYIDVDCVCAIKHDDIDDLYT